MLRFVVEHYPHAVCFLTDIACGEIARFRDEAVGMKLIKRSSSGSLRGERCLVVKRVSAARMNLTGELHHFLILSRPFYLGVQLDLLIGEVSLSAILMDIPKLLRR
jgi:hypothetical protein